MRRILDLNLKKIAKANSKKIDIAIAVGREYFREEIAENAERFVNPGRTNISQASLEAREAILYSFMGLFVYEKDSSLLHKTIIKIREKIESRRCELLSTYDSNDVTWGMMIALTALVMIDDVYRTL